jgi:hypothetical protein
MSKEDIKKQLHDLIDNTDDEEILSIVKEDLVAYKTGDKKYDDLSDLCDEDRMEMEELINENPMKDTISFEEFKENTEKWRSELLQKRDSKTK